MHGRFFKVILAGVLLLSVAAACGPEVERPVLNNASAYVDPILRIGGSLPGNYLAGRQALKRNDFYQASKFLDTALQTSPNNTFLINRTFSSKLAMGDVEGAYRLVTSLERSDIRNPIIKILIIVEAIKRNRLKDAQETVESIPEEGLNRFLKPLLKSWVLMGLGDGDSAIDALKTLKRHPELRSLYEVQVAFLLDALGKIDVAEKHYRLAAKLSRQPSLRIIQALGRYFDRTGKIEKAKILYIKYLKDNPNSVVFQRALSRLKTEEKPPLLVANAKEGAAEALFSIASMIARGRSNRLALIYGHLATYLRSDLDVGYMLTARLLEAMARYDDAITTYRKVAEESPFNRDARL
ncbi:MAG: tetratricopeptide repeat protein, partial [Pseudomonadota bacterium]|nr:tetratricopeptide repeat protein [Pseudomonadota bacterium]